jgi:hypothetical protein
VRELIRGIVDNDLSLALAAAAHRRAG